MSIVSDRTASDIRSNDWVDRWAPSALRPYLRLARIDRPIGIWLLMFPCWWGVALAGPGWPEPKLLFLFATGAVLMRAAGCTLNDIADREFDARVARTATRPLPSGAVSLRQAMIFMVVLCLASFIILLQFNHFSIALGASSLLIVACYPFAKRITYWPQVVLGLAFNWGALLGWSAVTGDLRLPAILLYLSGVLWTLGYDTIYAYQDKDDDIRIGVKSSAIALAGWGRPVIGLFYAGAWCLLIVSALTAGLAQVVVILMLPVAGHFIWQAVAVDLTDPKDCLAKFKSNQIIGIAVFAALVLARVLA